MDILIKGMEMPKSCNGCKLATHYFTNTHKVRCFINAEMREAEDIESRPKWCPLVALPEHGDLADKIDMIHLIEKIADADLAQDIIGEILASPTIVEATE